MGCFSNGSEGLDYQERYCKRCIHREDQTKDRYCPLWSAHLVYSYSGGPEAQEILNRLIPRSEDGLSNEQCAMFVERAPFTEADKLYLKWKAGHQP